MRLAPGTYATVAPWSETRPPSLGKLSQMALLWSCAEGADGGVQIPAAPRVAFVCPQQGNRRSMMDDTTIERIGEQLMAAMTALSGVLGKDLLEFNCEHGAQVLRYLMRWLVNDELGREPACDEFESLLDRVWKSEAWARPPAGWGEGGAP